MEWSDSGPAGRAAPLDLIEEHLTFSTSESGYRRGVQAGRLIENWFFPDEWNGQVCTKTPVLKVQSFAKGGYEAVVRYLDVEKIGAALDFGGQRGKRSVPEERDPMCAAVAAARAKRKVRLLVKNMMATHLVTFTRREEEGSSYWQSEDWAKAWDRFRRLLSKVIGDFPYVAILERHQKGNFHLHVAWCGRVPVGLVRKMWLAVLGARPDGRSAGNIDAQKIRVSSGGDRATRIARYISKYVSKGFDEDSRFNKKRYWASRQTLEEARRYVLRGASMDEILKEVSRILGLNMGGFVGLAVRRGKVTTRWEHFYPFATGDGFWLNYIPELHGGADPPF